MPEDLQTRLLPRNIGLKRQGNLLRAFTSSAWTGPAVALHLMLGTAIWKALLLGDNGDVQDAFYFAVVTFLTIGYGDIAPATPLAKLFFMLYIILSLLLQLTVVTSFVSNTISIKPSPPKRQTADPDADISVFLKVQPRVKKACEGFIVLVLFVVAAAVMLRFGDGTDWLDCFYWSLTTLSTVGYGDITPEHYRGVFACFFLVSVIIFGFILGELMAILIEIVKLQKLNQFFAKGITPELIDHMDVSEDGNVSRWEFMSFILQELDLVDAHQIDQILDIFDSVDLNGDGVLNTSDIRQHLRSSESTRAANAFASGITHAAVADARDGEAAGASSAGRGASTSAGAGSAAADGGAAQDSTSVEIQEHGQQKQGGKRGS